MASDVVNGSKLSSEMERLLGLSWWAQYNHKAVYILPEAGEWEKEKWCFEAEWCSHWLSEASNLQKKAAKRQRPHPPLQSPEWAQLCATPDLTPFSLGSWMKHICRGKSSSFWKTHSPLFTSKETSNHCLPDAEGGGAVRVCVSQKPCPILMT